MTPGHVLPAIGDEMPAFVRGSGFEYWNRYAAVNDEFVDIHMLDDSGRRAGYQAAIGMGNLTWAYFHVALHEWFGEGATITTVKAQFRAAVTRGADVHVRGTVTALRTGPAAEVDVEIWAESSDGALLAPGTATVRLARAQ
jgi:MaoC like domain